MIRESTAQQLDYIDGLISYISALAADITPLKELRIAGLSLAYPYESVSQFTRRY